MNGKNRTPKYAVRLVVFFVLAGTIFFGGLRFFVPDGSRLTGSYDAKSLLYIAAAPVSYAGSKSCGADGCHTALFNEWAAGAHGAKQEQSKCEVCHGPMGGHPTDGKIKKVRGDGDIVQLCLVCHRKMKARSTTGQPQIVPQEHPYPHEGVLSCTQCHNPHSPRLGAPKASAGVVDKAQNTNAPQAPKIAEGCISCHGAGGTGGFAPALAGQSVKALKDKLGKYKSGELKNPMMNPVAAPLSDKDIDTLANYFAKPNGNGAVTSGEKVKSVTKEKAAKTVAVESLPIAQNCFSCHGPSGRGGFAPVLAGQSANLLKDKLVKYKAGSIVNPMMNPVASALTDKEIDALAHYFAKL